MTGTQGEGVTDTPQNKHIGKSAFNWAWNPVADPVMVTQLSAAKPTRLLKGIFLSFSSFFTALYKASAVPSFISTISSKASWTAES